MNDDNVSWVSVDGDTRTYAMINGECYPAELIEKADGRRVLVVYKGGATAPDTFYVDHEGLKLWIDGEQVLGGDEDCG